MAKSNLQPIAISVLETQASTKKLDCQKKWLAVQNVADQVCIVGLQCSVRHQLFIVQSVAGLCIHNTLQFIDVLFSIASVVTLGCSVVQCAIKRALLGC